ncbi:histidine ammonia-lyase, partial [Mesorhizobium sp. M7D.F.Ca.US.004.03.1.1]
MTALVLTGTSVGVGDVAAVARDGRKVEIGPDVIGRLQKARKVLDQAAASGQQIYGLNTGLGANLGTSVEGDASTFQRQLLEGRSGAVGEALPVEAVRATMVARAAMLSAGGSGLSPSVFVALVDALNAGVHPVMPSLGSIGAGDLVLMTALARMLTGEGEADYQGRRMPAAKALMMARLAPISLAPKDGLSLINASAVSAGSGALAVTDALSALAQQQQAGALTMEGFGANRTILDPRLHMA